MHNATLESEVMNLIREETLLPFSKISLNSTLLGDLGIDGDDAWDVFERCQAKYHLDLSEFEFQRYFRNEPCFKGPIYFWRKLKYRDEQIAAQKEPITVLMLIDACASGAWRRNALRALGPSVSVAPLAPR